MDFEHERREEVLQYLFERYGRDRAGMTAAVITYRPRSAIRDIGRALALSNDRIDKLANQMEHVDHEEQFPERMREGGIEPDSVLGKRVLELLNSLLTFPRHLSQHSGGMVMSRGLLSELVPIENASMPGRTSSSGTRMIGCSGLAQSRLPRAGHAELHSSRVRSDSVASQSNADTRQRAIRRSAGLRHGE